jgi:hypothetical protein
VTQPATDRAAPIRRSPFPFILPSRRAEKQKMVQIAKGLRRRKSDNSLRAIAADPAARGYVNANGKEFSAASVRSMLS